MKRGLKIAIPLFLCFLYFNSIGQSPQVIERLTKEDSFKTIFYLPAHTQLNDVPWRDSIYMFNSFQSGKITFSTGYSPEDIVRVNYNLYRAEMDMITDKNDTVQIKRSKELKLITIGDHIFLHEYKIGYIEIINRLPVALGARKMMITAHMEFVSGNAQGTYGVGYDVDMRGRPSGNDRYYRKGEYYFFIGKDNKAYKPTPASARKVFSSIRKEVNDYIAKNSPNFDNKEDLEKMIVYCNEMANQTKQ